MFRLLTSSTFKVTAVVVASPSFGCKDNKVAVVGIIVGRGAKVVVVEGMRRLMTTTTAFSISATRCLICSF